MNKISKLMGDIARVDAEKVQSLDPAKLRQLAYRFACSAVRAGATFEEYRDVCYAIGFVPDPESKGLAGQGRRWTGKPNKPER